MLGYPHEDVGTPSVEALRAALRAPCARELLVPPGPAELLRPGEVLTALPRSGAETYLRAAYIAPPGGLPGGERFPAERLPLLPAALGSRGGRLLLQGPSPAPEGRWELSAGGIAPLGRALAREARALGAELGAGALGGWRQALGLLLEGVGPRFGACLAWRLYRAGDLLLPAQAWEYPAFCVLAGWFPGLCDLPPGGALGLRRPALLHALLLEALAERGWLPDAPLSAPPAGGPRGGARHQGGPAVPGPPGALGAASRARSAELTGHHRWLCLEETECGAPTCEQELPACAAALAALRGVASPAVLAAPRGSPEQIARAAEELVLLSPGPLVLALHARECPPECWEAYRRHLFPYAALILLLGTATRQEVDLRSPPPPYAPLPPALPPPLYVTHGHAELGPRHLEGGIGLLLMPPQAVGALVASGAAAAHDAPPAQHHAAVALPCPCPPAALHPAAAALAARARVLLVVGAPPGWREGALAAAALCRGELHVKLF